MLCDDSGAHNIQDDNDDDRVNVAGGKQWTRQDACCRCGRIVDRCGNGKEIHGIISRLEHTGSKHEDHGENLLHKIEDDARDEGGSHFIAGEKLSDRSACKHPEKVG